MRNQQRKALRLLLRSFHATAASPMHEIQTIVIVFLATVVWMLWAMLTFGKGPAFLLTLPTCLPPLVWLDRRRAWIDRRDERAERRA